jgi:PAS domain S-box-containing protein
LRIEEHKSVIDLAGAGRFALLIDAVVDYAIFMLDEKGFVRTWNPGAERIKGYRPSEIIGQHFSRFFSPEDQSNGLPSLILREAAKHGRYEAEGWRIRKGGTRFWANAILDVIRNDAGEPIGFVKITRDVTERKAAQEALIESERRFRLLVQGVSDYAIYMLDPNGVITNWNAGAERMKGYLASEIIGQHFSQFYSREDRMSGLPVHVLETAARTGRYEAEGWRYRKDGSRFWASVVMDAIKDETGQLIGFAKITRDITERKVAQDILRESERQFRLLVEGVTDYALYMLDPNGIVTSWNKGAQRIKGYSSEEIIGHHFSRFYTELERSAGVPARALHTAGQEGRFEAEGWRVRKDGTRFWASVVIDAIRDETGVLIGFAKLTRDVTERRENEIALQKAQLERNRAQKMEALGQLTGGVAHDFNNLLMIVSGHIRQLRKLVPAEDARGQRSLDAIDAAAARGQSLTRQLLTFSRRQTLNPVPVEIAPQLASLRTLVESSMGPSYRLVFGVLSDVWPVRIDADEFELALVNLVLNARDATPNGGEIKISATNVQLDGKSSPEQLTGDFVALSVTDAGCGIPEDVLSKIFDPFFTTKGPGNGTGLGLAQVQGFAHQSGGMVTVRSELRHGTVFTLYLPRSLSGSSESDGNIGQNLAAAGTLLLVEDNPDVAEATASLIEDLGFSVQVAGGAQAALEILAKQDISVVVSDIVMAGPIDGVDLGRMVREKYANLPVILITGYNNRSEEARDEFIVLRKPFSATDLARAIARIQSEASPQGATNVIRMTQSRKNAKPES